MPEVVRNTVSLARVEECIESARFWAVELEKYAFSSRRRADNFAIASGSLGLLTGLGAWGTLAASDSLLAVLAVSVVGLASGIVGLVPKINQYGDRATTASTLATRYGHVLGELVDARELLRNSKSKAREHAAKAVNDFEAVREQKNLLPSMPSPRNLKQRMAQLQTLRDQQKQ